MIELKTTTPQRADLWPLEKFLAPPRQVEALTVLQRFSLPE
jgi:hypothetical protein